MCRIEAAGVELLDGPISTSPSFCNEFTMKRVDKIEVLLKELVGLQDPQFQLVLRSCAGLPRFNFALRTSLPNRITQAIVAFDKVVEILNDGHLGARLSKEQRE
jgi:hypothetical protein